MLHLNIFSSFYLNAGLNECWLFCIDQDARLGLLLRCFYSAMLRLSILWYKHKTQDMTRKASSYLNTTHIIFLCSLLKNLVETTIYFFLNQIFCILDQHVLITNRLEANLPSVKIRCVFNNFTSICSICPSSSLSSFT